MKATLILVLVNVIFIGVAFYLQDRGNLIVLAAILGLATLMTYFLHRHAQKPNTV